MRTISEIKKDFPIFTTHPEMVYLDTAATSQTPQSVLSAMNTYYTDFRANIHRGLYEQSETASERYEHARKTVAAFINAAPEEVIFTSGSTAGMNMLCYSLEQALAKNPGRIVASVMEHHSVLVPLQQLAVRAQAEFVPIHLKGTELDYAEAEKVITPETSVVAVTLGSNVLGTMNDISRIAKLARDAGAYMIVDATAAAGHISIDVTSLDADIVVFSGHKMCGPTGIGVLWGRKDILAKLPPSFFGGGIVERVSWEQTDFQDPPRGLEPGTPNIAGAIGLAEAVSYIESLGVSNIHDHVADIFSYAVAKLKEQDGITVFAHENPKENVGVISFVQDGIHPHDTAEILARHNIAVRAGHHCAQPLMEELGVSATVRVSFYMYNTREDVDALIVALSDARKVLNK